MKYVNQGPARLSMGILSLGLGLVGCSATASGDEVATVSQALEATSFAEPNSEGPSQREIQQVQEPRGRDLAANAEDTVVALEEAEQAYEAQNQAQIARARNLAKLAPKNVAVNSDGKVVQEMPVEVLQAILANLEAQGDKKGYARLKAAFDEQTGKSTRADELEQAQNAIDRAAQAVDAEEVAQ